MDVSRAVKAILVAWARSETRKLQRAQPHSDLELEVTAGYAARKLRCQAGCGLGF